MMENPGISQFICGIHSTINLPDDLPIHQRLEGHFDSQKKGYTQVHKPRGDGFFYSFTKSPSSQEILSGKLT